MHVGKKCSRGLRMSCFPPQASSESSVACGANIPAFRGSKCVSWQPQGLWARLGCDGCGDLVARRRCGLRYAGSLHSIDKCQARPGDARRLFAVNVHRFPRPASGGTQPGSRSADTDPQAEFLAVYSRLPPEARRFMRLFLQRLDAEQKVSHGGSNMPSGDMVRSAAREVSRDHRYIAIADRLAARLARSGSVDKVTSYLP